MESLRGHVTFNDVTSGEKTELGRILCNFRVTFDDVTSGSHATSGHAQLYILHYYGKKKARESVANAHAITSCHVTSSSGHVTSGHVISGQGRFR